MILLDGTDRHNIDKADDRFYGSTTIRLPEQVAARGGTDSCSLPDYDTSEEQQKVFQQTPIPARWRPTRTFWRAAIAAFVAYIVLSLAICIPFVVKAFRKKDGFVDWKAANTAHANQLQALSNGPSLESRLNWDLQNITCDTLPSQLISSSSATYEGKTYHSVIVEYDTLPLPLVIRSNITRGDLLPGKLDASLTVDVAKDNSHQGLHYQVTVKTTSGPPLDYTKLCFSDQKDHTGLSIFPVKAYTGGEELEISIHLTIPRTGSLKALTTYLPQFIQNFNDLEVGLEDAQLTVEGANMPITFKSLRAGDVSVCNVDGPIQGSFNVSTGLDLNVVKGSIDTNVVLYTPTREQEGPRLRIDSVQSPVTVALTLDSRAYVPTFEAEVRSINEPVNMDITQTRTTTGAAIALTVDTAMADANIAITDELNGWYDVQSRLGSVEVKDFSASNKLQPEYTSKDKAVGLFDSNSAGSPVFSSRGRFTVRSSFGQASFAFMKKD